MMDTINKPSSTTEDFSQFKALHAEVMKMNLTGKLGVDQAAEILYETDANGQGHFFKYVYDPS